MTDHLTGDALRSLNRTPSLPTCYLVWNASPRRKIADSQPDPRLLGRLGRMGARRHGFLHLRPGAGPRAARPAAALRHRRHPGQHRLLRRHALRHLPGRLGLRLPLGAAGRPLRPRPHPGAHHPLLFALHFPGMRRRERLAARRLPLPRRRRHRRRVDDRRRLRRRRVARIAPRTGRRLDAHRLLFRHFSRRASSTTPSARTTAGAPCSPSAARPRCWSPSSATACTSRSAGSTASPLASRLDRARSPSSRSSLPNTAGARS